MRLPALVLAVLCTGSTVFAQVSRPLTHHLRLIPPEPRDGEGTATTIVPILIYHSIRPYVESDTPGVRRYVATPEALESELAWLRENGYTSVSFDDLVSHITTGSPLPEKPVILSFDDDWEGQYRYGLPLLEKYGFTATFYIWVVVVGRKNHMSWDQIRDLAGAGMKLGAHTMTHPFLTRVRTGGSLQREILGSKEVIEARTGVAVTSLAYPFGQYDQRVVEAARAAGFTSARSTWPGVIHSKEGLFSLTGLIRTETERSLVDTMQRYLTQSAAADGLFGASGTSASFGSPGPESGGARPAPSPEPDHTAEPPTAPAAAP